MFYASFRVVLAGLIPRIPRSRKPIATLWSIQKGKADKIMVE